MKLDKEIKNEEAEAKKEEEGGNRKPAATWEAAYGMKKAGRHDAKAGFGTRQVEGPRGFKAGEIAAEGGELVFHP